MRTTFFIPLLGILGLLSACQGGKEADPEAEQPPNIVFILADDFGYTSLNCYGAEKSLIRTTMKLKDFTVKLFRDNYQKTRK